MPKKQTASDEWAAMPRVAEEVLPQMKRDYQALVLANSLDPKRFMRGGNRAGKIPEKFAVSGRAHAGHELTRSDWDDHQPASAPSDYDD